MKPSTSSVAPKPFFQAGSLRRLREVDPRITDAMLAVLLTAGALAILASRSSGSADFRADDALGATVVSAQTLSVAVRRFAPFPVLIFNTAALLTHSALGYEVVQAGTLSSLVVLYSATSLTDRRTSLIAAAIAVAGITGFFATNRGEYGIVDIAAIGGTWAVAWIAGEFVRERGEQAQVAGARAIQLELERDSRAREAVADERARMARELHDIVGHALNVIVLQAGGARRVFDTRPAVARDALASVESVGREALLDMERMLGVLRSPNDDNGEITPQPGLQHLHDLAARVSSAGVPTRVLVEGDSKHVPAMVQLSAYRIVQEALTNVLKHSGASSAAVTVRNTPGAVELEVTDDGRGSAGRGDSEGRAGRGLLGMRERVALFGGELKAGQRSPNGGYAIRAKLPFQRPGE